MMSSPKHILVPTDFSETAQQALEYAVGLAAKLGAEVTLLHAYVLPVVGLPEGGIFVTSEIAQRILDGAQGALDAAVKRHEKRGVAITALLKNGDPREVIDAVAGQVGADLIVMGTHGRRGLSRILIGSVAEYVVRTASHPVLTVQGPVSVAKARAAEPRVQDAR
jgi:nucleotide-binding universal stress UspA family protein